MPSSSSRLLWSPTLEVTTFCLHLYFRAFTIFFSSPPLVRYKTGLYDSGEEDLFLFDVEPWDHLKRDWKSVLCIQMIRNIYLSKVSYY